MGTSTWASSPIEPSVSTRTRSARRIASSTSWVTSSTAGRWRAHSSWRRACMRIRVRASSAPNGSSSSSSSGSRTRARARATRWASPPDSVTGQARAWPARSTSSSAARPRSSVARPDRQPHRDVAQHPGPGQQAGLLEHDGPPGRDERPPVVAGVEPAEGPQQGALARPAAAEEGHELAGADRQVEPGQHLATVERASQGLDHDGVALGLDGTSRGVGGGHGQVPVKPRRQASSVRSRNRTMPSARSPSSP